MGLVSVVSSIWPATFVVAVLSVYLLITTHLGYSRTASVTGATASLALLGLLYFVAPVRNSLRLALTLLGFAAPVALSILAIRYTVEPE